MDEKKKIILRPGFITRTEGKSHFVPSKNTNFFSINYRPAFLLHAFSKNIFFCIVLLFRIHVFYKKVVGIGYCLPAKLHIDKTKKVLAPK